MKFIKRLWNIQPAWSWVVNQLQERFGDGTGMVFDDHVDRTFIEHGETTPYQEPWVGVIHHAPGLPEWFHPATHRLEYLLSSPAFQDSLEHCKGLVTLCPPNADFLQAMMPSLPLTMLPHPCPLEGFPKWSWDAFHENRRKQFIQVGWSKRNHRFIDQAFVPSPLYRKVWLKPLPTDVMTTAMAVLDSLSPYRKRGTYGKPEVIERVSDGEYDRLLTRNVMGTEFLAAGASTTVLDCITRNAPLIVNRLPALEAYLGKDYPLFFETISMVPNLLDPSIVKAGHEYLATMDKSFLDVSYFIKGLGDFIKSV